MACDCVLNKHDSAYCSIPLTPVQPPPPHPSNPGLWNGCICSSLPICLSKGPPHLGLSPKHTITGLLLHFLECWYISSGTLDTSCRGHLTWVKAGFSSRRKEKYRLGELCTWARGSLELPHLQRFRAGLGGGGWVVSPPPPRGNGR